MSLPLHDKRFHNLTGKQFGHLTAECLVSTTRYQAGGIKRIWRFRCDCGNAIEVVAMNIVAGRQTCCGCRRTTESRIDNQTVRA